MRKHLAPLLVSLLMLLSASYLGSYAALVNPTGVPVNTERPVADPWEVRYYRFGGTAAGKFFWPLEQVDRKLRPNVWQAYY